MVLYCTVVKYIIIFESVLGIWTLNWLIPSSHVEMTRRWRRTREEYASQCLKEFPKNDIILTHYMLIAWWIYLIAGLGYYVIWTRKKDKVMLISPSPIYLGYTYTRHRLKKYPYIYMEIINILRFSTWNKLRIYPPRTRKFVVLTGTAYQEVPINFETSMQYTLWDSVCNNYINP